MGKMQLTVNCIKIRVLAYTFKTVKQPLLAPKLVVIL